MREGPPLSFQPEVDALGRPLCNSALWGVKCRRGAGCAYSHDVPDVLRQQYDIRRAETALAKQAANRERWRQKNAPPPCPASVSQEAEKLRVEAVLRYEPLHHPLGKLIAEVLECTPGEELGELHLRPELPEEPPLCPTLQHAFKLGGRKVPGQWRAVMGPGRNKKVIARLHSSSAYKSWLAGYDEWVRAVVAPAIGGAFYYQRPPTLRIAMPSRAPTIAMHRDADYPHHHAAEVRWADSAGLGLGRGQAARGRGGAHLEFTPSPSPPLADQLLVPAGCSQRLQRVVVRERARARRFRSQTARGGRGPSVQRQPLPSLHAAQPDGRDARLVRPALPPRGGPS